VYGQPSSAFPIRRLQPCMDNLLDNDLVDTILWEESDLPATTPSLNNCLIPKLNIQLSVIKKIKYTTGVPILVGPKWQLDKDAIRRMPKQRQERKGVMDDTNSDTEGFGTENEGSSVSAMLDTSDQSWSPQEFDPNKSNRNPT
jgi:hypothetical protein